MKRYIKKIGLGISAVACVCMLWGAGEMPVYASGEVNNQEENGRATNLEWYYKYIDGELMMRLWNHTTQQWITDWVPAVGSPD